MIQSCSLELFPLRSVGRNGTNITGLLVINTAGVCQGGALSSHRNISPGFPSTHPSSAKWLQLGTRAVGGGES